MDRNVLGRRLAVVGTVVALVALTMYVAADAYVYIESSAFLHETGSTPYAVVVYQVEPGQHFALTSGLGADGGFRGRAIESQDLQRALDGGTVGVYATSTGNEISFTRSGLADPDAGIAILFQPAGPLTADARARFAQTVQCLEDGGCRQVATVGSREGEFLIVSAWGIGAVSLSAVTVGILLWRPWRAGDGEITPMRDPGDLVALFGRARAYVSDLRRFAFGALVLVVLLLSATLAYSWSIVEDVERRANVPVFLWVVLGLLTVFAVPAILAWRTYVAARDEETRLSILADQRPL